MAVSSVGNPGDFNPVYNPVVYYVNSTNKNQLGFRYVVDVYYNGTSTKIAEFRVAPRSFPTNDGYGEIDLSGILRNLVSYDFNGTNTTTLAAPNSQIAYNLRIGEEYVVNNVIASFSSHTVNGIAYTRVTTTLTNPFALNDQVVVNDPLISGTGGLFTVIADTSTTQITIDLPWNPAYAGTATGTIAYADNRKVITRDLLDYGRHTAYNAAFSFADFRTYNNANYKLSTSSTTRQLLTDMPDQFYAFLSQDIWLNYAPFYSTSADRLFFNNSNGDYFSKPIADGTVAVKQVAVGPNNFGSLTLVVGTPGLIKSDTTWYEILVVSSSATVLSKRYRINLKRDCKIEPYEIVFLDRKGSFGSMAFSLRSKKMTTATPEIYTQQVGNLSGGKYTYNTYDRFAQVTNVDLDTVLELNADFFTTDPMLTYYNQLISSPVTFVKLNGLYYQCLVQDLSDTLNPVKNINIQSKTLRVKLVNEIINA